MIALTAALLALVSVPQQSTQAIAQESNGWCSPNVANVSGNVTITCVGVDPRALTVLNAELQRRDSQLTEKIREANRWARRYKELESELGHSMRNSKLSREAEDALHRGDLDKAGAVLDKILGEEEKDVDDAARGHFERAMVFLLQFKPMEALPHLAQAYRYRPDRIDYGEEYSYVLITQNDFAAAEPVLVASIGAAEEQANPSSADRAQLANMLDNLGVLYRHTHQLDKSETNLEKSRDLRLRLSEDDWQAYDSDLGETLNALATLYDEMGRLSDAEAAAQNAVAIFEKIESVQGTPVAPDLLIASNNLAKIYRDENQLPQAITLLQKVVDSYRILAASKSPVYLAGLAGSLQNLALLYSLPQGAGDAYRDMTEAIGIFRDLARQDAAEFRPMLASALMDFGLLNRGMGKIDDAEANDKEALKIYRDLATQDPEVYQINVADALNNLGNVYRVSDRPESAEEAFIEAVGIDDKLSRDLDARNERLGRFLQNLGLLYSDTVRFSEAEDAYVRSIAYFRGLYQESPKTYGPDLASAMSGLGSVYSRSGAKEKAAEQFNEAVDILCPFADSDPASGAVLSAALQHLWLLDPSLALEAAENHPMCFHPL